MWLIQVQQFGLTFMTDIDDIYKTSETLEENNYKAISLIYKSWAYSIVTDLYGDIPYSEQLRPLKVILSLHSINKRHIH
jgi:hypothetical protein